MVHRLRLQPDVRHHRYAAFGQASNGVGDDLAAFELDRLRTALLQQPRCVAQRVGGVRLVSHERHVGDDQRSAGATNDRLGVVDNVVQCHRNGGIQTENDFAQRVAHQDHRNLSFVHQPCGRMIVRGHAGYRLPRAFHGRKLGDPHPVCDGASPY